MPQDYDVGTNKLDGRLAYDPRTQWLHWITAALVVFMWIGAHAIDWFPKGPMRVDARSVHILMGTGLGILVIYRLFWRVNRGARLAKLPGWPGVLARLVHLSLYALILGVVGLGMFNASIRGDSLFGLMRIPAFGSYDAAVRHAFSEVVVGYHALGANLVLVLAFGHAVLALIHQYILKDNLLARMLPRIG